MRLRRLHLSELGVDSGEGLWRLRGWEEDILFLSAPPPFFFLFMLAGWERSMFAQPFLWLADRSLSCVWVELGREPPSQPGSLPLVQGSHT